MASLEVLFFQKQLLTLSLAGKRTIGFFYCNGIVEVD